MLAKLRVPRKSNKRPSDELGSTAKETKVTARESDIRGPATLDPQVRHHMIACAAYYRAEKRSFAGGEESQFHDWLAAEAEIEHMLAGTSIKPQ